MAQDKISAMTAAVAADVAGSAGRMELCKAYATTPTTLGLDFQVLRTSMFAGSTGYTATDPITAGAASFTTLAASGVTSITNTTEATTGPAGALVVSGGIYSAKKVFSIGDLTVGASTFVVTAATGAVAASTGVNGTYEHRSTNTTNDTASSAMFRLYASTSYGMMQVFAPLFTTASHAIAASMRLYSAGAGGLSIVAGNGSGDVRIYARDVLVATFGAGTTLVGALAITGALTGVTTAAISGNVTGNTNKWGFTGATGNLGIGGLPTATSRLNITGLPTAAAGLAAGDVWANSGVLTIV